MLFRTGRPDHVRLLYVVAGIVAGVGLVVLSGTIMIRFGMQPLAGVVAGILSAVIIVLFGWFMPSRTIRGTRELEKVRGFEEFLTRVESDRMDRTIKTPAMFERFLPYAMALGVADNWAKAFDGIYKEPPQWYTGPGGVHTFQPSRFTSSLGAMSTQAATAMASAPRSGGGSGFGGGGSSGGGFGGGGLARALRRAQGVPCLSRDGGPSAPLRSPGSLAFARGRVRGAAAR